jgi:predicted ATPase
VADAIAGSGPRHGQRWHLPELLRIKSEVLPRQAAAWHSQVADDCFGQAAEIAREQGALFWELRIALSLARLRMSQCLDDETKQILMPVYERFTDGYETIDLRTARAMLDAISI